jgi:hypothetical protein
MRCTGRPAGLLAAVECRRQGPAEPVLRPAARNLAAVD